MNSSFYLLHLAIIVIALSINVGAHLLVMRVGITHSMIKGVFVGFGTGFVAVLALNAILQSPNVTQSDRLIWLLIDCIIYAASGHCYFHFVQIGEASVRIRILRELVKSPQGLNRQELIKFYSAEWIIDARLERLVAGGFVVLGDDRRYRLEKKQMLKLAKTFQLLKLVVLGRRSFPASRLRG